MAIISSVDPLSSRICVPCNDSEIFGNNATSKPTNLRFCIASRRDAKLRLSASSSRRVPLMIFHEEKHQNHVNSPSKGDRDGVVNGSMESRCFGNLNMSFAYVEGESLLMGLKEVAVSRRSACTSASLEPSYVLKALGVHEDMAHTSIRFGIAILGGLLDKAVELTVKQVEKLREMGPLYEMVKEGIGIKNIQWPQQ